MNQGLELFQAIVFVERLEDSRPEDLNHLDGLLNVLFEAGIWYPIFEVILKDRYYLAPHEQN